jgi:DNA-binding NarL/FixJ family response regulator
LERSDDIAVIGEANTGPQVLAMINRRRPDVVLLDLAIPGIVGWECISTIRESWPDIKTVVLSATADPQSVDGALNAGAVACILKSANPSDLPAVIRLAAAGAMLQARSAPRDRAEPIHDPEEPWLSVREQAILSAVASGLTSVAIGQELFLSPHTIKFHLTSIYLKLGVTNRACAIRYALDHVGTCDLSPVVNP